MTNPFFPKHLLLGSDPEFLLTDIRGEKAYVLNAAEFVSQNREIRLGAYVGTDGHAATAEIRPRPTHNIFLHLADLATGLVEVKAKLSSRYPDVEIVAQPSLGTETCGGHIHVSYQMYAPWNAKLQTAGYIMDGYGKQKPCRANGPEQEWLTDDRNKLGQAMEAGTEYSTQVVVEKIHTIVGQFEGEIFRALRKQRDEGVPDLYFRFGNKFYRPKEIPNNYLHVWFEYRYPSTWLAHPSLAYCYLALTKLVMLNLPWIRRSPLQPLAVGKSRQFTNVLQSLLDNPAVIRTPDLRWLESKTAKWLAFQFSPPIKVDFAAWGRYARILTS